MYKYKNKLTVKKGSGLLSVIMLLMPYEEQGMQGLLLIQSEASCVLLNYQKQQVLT